MLYLLPGHNHNLINWYPTTCWDWIIINELDPDVNGFHNIFGQFSWLIYYSVLWILGKMETGFHRTIINSLADFIKFLWSSNSYPQRRHPQVILISSCLVIYQYISILVNFTMSGRKLDCMWFFYDIIKVLGKAVCGSTCKKCGREMQDLVARATFFLI